MCTSTQINWSVLLYFSSISKIQIADGNTNFVTHEYFNQKVFFFGTSLPRIYFTKYIKLMENLKKYSFDMFKVIQVANCFDVLKTQKQNEPTSKPISCKPFKIKLTFSDLNLWGKYTRVINFERTVQSIFENWFEESNTYKILEIGFPNFWTNQLWHRDFGSKTEHVPSSISFISDDIY